MSDFWSKRRAAVAAEAEVEAQAELAELEAQREADLAELSDDELLEQLDLPDPDQMVEGDDFSVFMKDAVPARLKTRALRRLWRVNPVLANVDGLVDYGEDFTDAAMVVENLQTTYQVGKGMLAHVKEMARQAMEDEASDAAPEALTEDAPEDLAEAAPVEAVTAQAAPIDAAPAPYTPQDPDTDPALIQLDPTRRRMQFHFEEPRPA